jgi:hypothetical protein
MAKHMREVRSSESALGRVWRVVFVVAAVAMMAVPFAATFVVPTTESGEKRELAAWPALTREDGSPNLAYLSELGDWFGDHYALRNQLVDANARVRAAALGTSSAQNVVVGTDGWLYYRGSVLDYQRQSRMSDRAVWNAAHNLTLASEYVEAKGGHLVVAVAPDKCTIYPEHLPYYVQAGSGASNVERLYGQLAANGVSYVDLAQAFSGSDSVLYRKEDTHWTAEGAGLAAQAIVDELNHAHEDFSASAVTTVQSTGDLASMLYPETAVPEKVPRYQDAWGFRCTNDASFPEDDTVQTASTAGGTGSLVMYRDSFGNAMLPFMATSYGTALFSRLIPYDLTAASGGSDVVVLRAERHVASFATRPAYLPAPERDPSVVEGAVGVTTTTTLTAEKNGPYVELKGSVDPRNLPTDAVTYATVTGEGGISHTYECYTVSSSEGQVADAEGTDANDAAFEGDDGYLAYVPADACPQGVADVVITVSSAMHSSHVLSTQVDFRAILR